MAHRRRGPGVAGLKASKAQMASFRKAGDELNAAQLESVQAQMAVFQRNLEEFAAKHRKTIKKNPEFRKHFQDMWCV